jgi:filamentous hemagglutinin
MDVRHFNFLARQPSAKLRERSSFWGMPKRGIALILANAMFWQPLIAQAEGIAVSGGTSTSTTQAGNGVPIVNIAAPNATGLSHNQYQQYNVGAEGVILNNATARTQNTQLGGIIVGNPNFSGTAAGTILNEVVGANASQLKGYTEVAGQAVRVIVANPHGISCDGCGFINTPRVTLTTGKPVLDNGRLDRFQVDGGNVSVDGAGLNADNVDQFEIITRATQINAQINARQLTMVAGRNDVDAQTLNPTARADDGSAKPGVAIDSSALGGMYAGAIKLVGTEAGVGVRLAGNLAASAGDIQIDANGQLNLAQTSAASAVNIKAASLDAAGPVYAGTSLTVKTSGDMITRQNTAARDAIQLDSGGQLTNVGVIEAGVNADNIRNASGDIAVTAQNLRNSGSLTASRTLTAQVSKTLDNRGGTLNSQAQARITAGTLDNRQAGRVLSQGSLDITAAQLLNAQNGLVSSSGNLTVNTDYLDNTQGKFSTTSALTIRNNGQMLNQLGLLNASGAALINTGTLDNRNGEVSSLGDLSVSGSQLDNSGGGRLLANGDVALTFDSVNNQAKGIISGQRDVQLNVGQLNNTGAGNVSAKRTLNLTASRAVDNTQGTLRSDGTLNLGAASLNNTAGSITSADALTLTTTDSMVNQGGEMLAGTRLTLNSARLDNSQKGRIAGNNVEISSSALDNRNGEISSLGDLSVTGAQADNSGGGRLLANGDVALTFDGVNNQAKGVISGQRDVQLNVGQLSNTGAGSVYAKRTLALNASRTLDNTQGVLRSDGSLSLRAASLGNTGGSITSAAASTLTTTDAIVNQGGELLAGSQLTLSSARLDNSQKGRIAGNGVMVSTGAFGNQQGGSLTSTGTLRLTAGQVDNSAAGRIASAQTLTATVTGLDQHNDGRLYGNGDVSLDLSGGVLNNQGGLITAPGQLLLNNLTTVNNQGGEISSSNAFSLIANTLQNTDGTVLSKQALTVRIGQQLNNVRGLVSGTGVAVTAAELINDNGTLGSDADLSVTTSGQLSNRSGEVSAAGSSVVNAASLDNTGGQITADQRLNLSIGGALDNQAGTLGAGQGLSIQATSLDNRQAGVVVTDADLGMTLGGALDNRTGGSVQAKGPLSLKSLVLDNRGGRLSTQSTLTLNTGSTDNRGGLIRADQAMQLAIDRLDNSQQGVINGKAGIRLTGQRLDNQSGLLSAVGPLQLQVNDVRNGAGRIASQSDLQATVDTLSQQGGQLVAQGTLHLTGQRLDNRVGGLVGATKALTLDVADIDNRAGELSGQVDVVVTTQQLDNSDGGKLLAGTALALTVQRLINRNKGLVFGDTLRLDGQSLDNTGGTLASRNGLTLALSGDLDNSAGLLDSEGALSLRANALENAAGSISSAAALDIVTLGALRNQNGSISTDSTLTLASASLDNRNAGTLSGKGATRVDTGAFDNSQGGRLTSSDRLTLNAAQVSNHDAGRIASALALNATVTGLDQQGGQLFSNTALTLDLNHGLLNNQNGLINAPGALVLNNLGDVINRHGEISSAQAFTFSAQSLDNSAGKLLSSQALAVGIEHGLNNLEGTIAAQQLEVSSESLDNGKGLISSRSGLNLVVGALMNQSGTVIADGDLLLKASTANNDLGQISSRKNLVAYVTRLQQQGGQLIAQGDLSLAGSTLDNRLNGLIGSTGALTVDVSDVDNRGGELSSQDAIAVNGQRLDNSDGGRVLAQRALALTVAGITNDNQGLLSSKTDVSIVGNTLSNSGGKLLGLASLDIGLAGQLSNIRGLVSSEGTLNARVGSLDNTSGSLSSAGPLTLDSAGAIGNQAGELVTDGALNLHSASLDNRAQGRISSKGALAITTGAFDNSQAGRVSSGDRLNLTTAQLTNRDGGSIGSGQALVASVSGLDQQGGTLFSKAALTLDLNNGALNNQAGLINAVGPLLLQNLNAVANQGGEISSAQAFTLTAQRLDNGAGKVLSNQALTLRIAQALSNVKGMLAAARLDVTAGSLDNSGGTLTSRGDLGLTTTGLLTNRNAGLINAAQVLTVRAGALDNQAGQLLGGSALTLDATTLNNTTKGLINSQGGLTLTAERLDSSDGGEVSAHGDLGLTLNALTQTNGRLLGDAGLSLDLNGADLNNRAGLINAKGPLTFNRLGNVNNQGGEISSAQSFTLAGRAFDNSSGRLISNTALTVNTSSMINQNGLISGWQGLSLTSGTLDNRSNGTLSSRNGDVSARLTGALLNGNGGALVSQKTLTVNAQSLDNRGGILSSGAGQSLVTSGALDNSQNGSIDSGGALTLQAAQLTNVAGNIAAQQDLSITGNTLDNSSGNLVGKGAVTLDLIGALTNTNGKLASGGLLRVLRASQIGNQGGQLVSQSLMNLNTGSLDNRNRGTVAANGSLLLTSSGAVLNSGDGLIYSQTANVQLQAASLANANGTLQSQGALGVNVTGDIDNQNGRIIAQNGDLSLGTTSLDSRGGVLSSLQGAFIARMNGVLKNGYNVNRQGGVIQAQRLDLAALGGFDNYGGRVSARSGDALIRANNFDNRNGALYAKGRVSFTGDNFDNSGDNDGQIAGRQIDLTLNGALNNRFGVIESDTTLNITAASLDNQTGKIRALGNTGATRFNIAGTLDNRNGTLESANTDFDFNVGGFLNAGGSLLHVGTGELGISTANVTNAGGSIVTRGGLTLNADSWTNSSVLQAGRLTVNVGNFTQTATGQLLAANAFTGTGSNWANDGLIASDGSLNLNLSGAYGGNGRVTSQGPLSLDAAQINLSASATITAGKDARLTTTGILTNIGQLTSIGSLTVNAASVFNGGSLGAGGDLRIDAGSMTNQNGLVFSGNDMKFFVDNLTNRYGDLYSIGSILIGGNEQGGRSSSVSNLSSTIESGSDLQIRAVKIENRKDIFETTGGLISGAVGIKCYSCTSFDGSQTPSYLVWIENYKSEILRDSASSNLTSGRDILVSGADLVNSNSTISATRNISFNLENFTSEGTSTGTYTVRKSFTAPSKGLSFWNLILDYNAINDPLYDSGKLGYIAGQGEFVRPNIRLWNTDDVQSLTRVFTKQGGESTPQVQFGPIWVSYPGGKFKVPAPQYQENIHTDPPAAVKNANFFNTTITYDTPSGSTNAVVQAGGSVSISATQTLTNSVVREGIAQDSAGPRMGSTELKGAVPPTIISINAQLPPNLAQQQVNPLSLPGFSLPTGQNGLFRLSGQSGSTTQATQATNLPQSWTFGGASVSLAQREQAVPDAQARSVQIGAVGPLSAATGQLDGVARQSAGISANASSFAISAPVDAGNGAFTVPGHQSDAGAMTSVGGVAGIATNRPAGSVALAGQSVAPAVNIPGITPITSASAQTVSRVQGVPSSAAKPNGNKYLIETNPVLTDLKQFMSSDYLLAGLGYDPDQSAKRLGDGFYEQRLVQQAITARTGQAFIDGQTSNEAQFRYLMNNAIVSKQAMNLSVGIGLTSEQVAALTHDIVWLETHEVNGEQVLVPVVYLAQATGRLGPTGALIAGNDVSLIAGQNLDNVGTLRATNNLSATAGNNLVNSGLIQAGNRLDLLAGNSVVNKAGGIIAGRDVSVTALKGDVINERTVTAVDNNVRGQSHNDYADSAARIEAANDLSVSAGRDINNLGSVLQSGRDLSLNAGRDVNLAATQLTDSLILGKAYTSSVITQVGSTITAGRDLGIQAGRDINVIASQLEAKRDVAMAATEDITISSAADEEHSYAKSKKVTRQEDHVTQVGSLIKAGGSVAASAGQDLAVIGSQIKATEDVALDAKRDVLIGAAENEDFSYAYKKKKGSFGRSSTKESQSYSSTNVGSVIEAGHDLTVNTTQGDNGGVTLNGGRNVTVVGSQLKAGNDLLLGGTGDVAILAGENESGASYNKTKSGAFGLSKSGGTQLQTQTTQAGSELVAGKDAVLLAGRDVQLSASNLTAGHDAQLQAGLIDKTGDVNLNAGSDEAYVYAESWKKKTGLFLNGGSSLTGSGGTNGFGVSVAKSEKNGQASQQTTSVGSLITAGNDASLGAARDITLTGSSVKAAGEVSLDAGRDITLAAGNSSNEQAKWSSKTASGLSLGADRNGFTGFAGKEAAKDKTTQGHDGASPSSLSGMDVSLKAERDILQAGSDVSAVRDVAYSAGRNITVAAANERDTASRESSLSRSGLTVTANHNIGNTLDAVKGAGQGEDAISKVSSTLAAVDAVDQFARGPTLEASLGNAKSSSTSTSATDSARGSTVEAGRDFTAIAGNTLQVNGSHLGAGRDINLSGRDISLGVATGQVAQTGAQKQSSAGINAGTTNGVKLGVGTSQGVANQTGQQQTSLASSLDAGRDINAQAKNDLTLNGTQASAGRDIQLQAGNDLTIKAAQNAYSSSDTRHSSGSEVGVTAGRGGIGAYVSANMGRGTLNRDGTQAQIASITAGNQLAFISGRDTTVAGAVLRGDSVDAKVGRDLTVTSVPDTGKASGKQKDISGTVTVGPIPGLSGSVGYGRTNGKTNWVGEQTAITAANQLNIQVGEHTQLNGALINSDTGKLHLDTQTLGFADISGLNKEHSYYLNVGGSFGASFGASGAQDPSQTGKGAPGVNGWSVQGYNATTDRAQEVRATVGAGDIVVRGDTAAGTDSTVGLNRDPSKAYEITRDEQHRTEVYASSSSIDAVRHPFETVDQWGKQLANYGDAQQQQITDSVSTIVNKYKSLALTIDQVPAAVRTQLTDANALKVAKTLVAGGVSPNVLTKMSPEAIDIVQSLVMLGDQILPCRFACSSGTPEASQQNSNPAPQIEPVGVIALPAIYVNPNDVEVFFENAARLSQIVDPASVETVMLVAQAAMGPAKFLVDQAIQVAIRTAAGKQLEEIKRDLAIYMVSYLNKENLEVVKKADTEAREKYANGTAVGEDKLFDGSKMVVGANFLVDSIAQAMLGFAGKAAGKVVSVGAKESAPSKTAVQELEVDAYKNLKAREVVGDGLEHDHIPSIAALRTAKEAELGRPLTELETKTLYQNSTAVEVPRDVHIAGPTYGGKNTPAQIQQDAADLCGAVCRDTEALRANLNSRGYDSKLVDETVQKIVERNRNTGVIK